jgi:putative MATE family efflux protein
MVYDHRLIRRDIFRLLIPNVAESALQMTAAFITAAMVGRLAPQDIAAQGIALRVMSFFWVIFRGIGVGATVAVAVQFGAGSAAKCRQTAEQAYLTVFPAAIILCLIAAFFPEQLLGIFTHDPALLLRSAAYLQLAVWYLPFAAVMSITTAAFSGQGNTRTPMVVAMVLNLIQVVVGYGAIFGIGGFHGLGLQGAAAATLISQSISCILGLLLLFSLGGPFAAVPRTGAFLRPKPSCLTAIYAIGLPAACENILWQLCAIVMTKVILTYGTESYAAFQLGLQAEELTDLTALAFITCSTALTSRAVGAKDGELFRAYFQQLKGIALTAAAIAMGILTLLPYRLMALLTDKTELWSIGAAYVFIMGLVQIPQVLTKVYSGVIRSLGGKRIPMYIAALSLWGFRIPFFLLAGLVWHGPINILWVLIASDMVLRMVFSIAYFKKKDLLHCIDRLKSESPIPPDADSVNESVAAVI